MKVDIFDNLESHVKRNFFTNRPSKMWLGQILFNLINYTAKIKTGKNIEL